MCAGVALEARADTDTFQQTSGNDWSQPSNWSEDASPNSSSTDVVIPGLASTDDISVTIGSLSLTSGASVGILESETLIVSGSVSDNGTIVVDSNQSGATGSTILQFNGSAVSGTGSIVLDFVGGNANVSGTLTQGASHTISGEGEITAALTNNGTVNADFSGQTMSLLTSNMTNNGVMESSSGATLEISGITLTQGSGGQLQANGGTVQLDSAATISGGTFNATNGGLFTIRNGGATLTNVTNNATVDQFGTYTLNITGTLTDDGTIVVNSNQDGSTGTTLMNFNGATVSGSGSILLNFQDGNATVSGTLTQGASHTISGYGEITAALTNNGTVDANVNNQTLALFTNNMTNNGVMESSSGGTLEVSGITLTQGTGGQLQANAGGIIQFDSGAVINGGILSSGNASFFYVAGGGATFENLTNNTTVDFLGTNSSNVLNITGTLVDNGEIVVNSNRDGSSGLTTLNLNNVAVSGTGDIVLDYVGGNATLSGTATQQAGHTISGFGVISATLTNNGTVNANAAGQTLTVTGAVTNNGLAEATEDGYLQFNASTLTNFSGNALTGGTYEADANSTLNLPGSVATNAATLVLNGSNASIVGITSLTSNQGSLSVLNGATLTTTGAVQNSGTLALSGELAVTGSLSLASTSRLLFQIGGRQQGSNYGFLDVSGSAALNGKLELSFANGFDSQVLLSDTFTILTSAFPIVGDFSNVTNGERLFADNSDYSFVVNFGPGSPFGADEIVLSDAIPEPSLWTLLALAPVFFGIRRTARIFG